MKFFIIDKNISLGIYPHKELEKLINKHFKYIQHSKVHV